MNEFMHFTPIFDCCKSFFAAVTVEAILSITLPVVFIFAVALVVAAALAAAPQRYTAAIHQSFAWWRVGVQMDDDYRRGLWYQARSTEDVLSVGESPVSEDLLSLNPLKARRARKAFWGENWRTACTTLTPEERISVYKRVLNK
jgi:hypothetical protein